MTVFTDKTFDPIARMNAAKEHHRAKGTSGGRPRPVMTDTLRRFRTQGMNASDLGYEIIAAIVLDIEADARQAAIVTLGDVGEGESCPF